MGDGLLAVFPIGPPGALAATCQRALTAAVAARNALAAANRARIAAGAAPLEFGVALDVGRVVYGNVGGQGRLDFTVIGPAVNEASRIEALCAQHEVNLLVSETFAEAATLSRERLVSIGRFMLRGVRGAQSLYTLDRP